MGQKIYILSPVKSDYHFRDLESTTAAEDRSRGPFTGVRLSLSSPVFPLVVSFHSIPRELEAQNSSQDSEKISIQVEKGKESKEKKE